MHVCLYVYMQVANNVIARIITFSMYFSVRETQRGQVCIINTLKTFTDGRKVSKEPQLAIICMSCYLDLEAIAK